MDAELAPSARASGSSAGCRSAPLCSCCPGRQSTPASANLSDTRKPLGDHGRPSRTCEQRRGSRAASCRVNPPSCHGAWRGGACATPRRVRRSVPMGTSGGGRRVGRAGRGSRRRGVVPPRPAGGDDAQGTVGRLARACLRAPAHVRSHHLYSQED